MQETVTVIVPCYNEKQRLAEDNFSELLEHPGLSILFVDDGSSDGTDRRLTELCEALGPRADTLHLGRNVGKGEAVRRGMRQALAHSPDVVGFVDADMATPAAEVLRMLAVMERRKPMALLGSRVRMLGHDIVRNPFRHYLGRGFATAVSLLLDLPIYDSQCGAKFFRRCEALQHALARPFQSRWLFDVELIKRLIHSAPDRPALSPNEFMELPLRSWRDVQGSKIKPASLFKIGLDFIVISIGKSESKRGDHE